MSSATAAGGSVLPMDKIRVVADWSDSAMGRIFEIFTREIGQRCPAEVSREGPSPLTVEWTIVPGLGAEGFRIADGTAGGRRVVRIAGNDRLGLLYGVGKFLHTSEYLPKGFVPSRWRGVSAPVCPVRGIYLATHYHNFYQASPIEKLKRYVEDLSLWGLNSLAVHFPQWQYDGYEQPAAQRMLARLKEVLRSAKSIGLRVGLIEAPNQGFASTPKALRATPVPDPMGRHGNFGVNLCPAKPAAHQLLLQNWHRLMEEFRGVGLDDIIYWPYDEGGCGCTNCEPWGGRGFPKLCRELSHLTRETFPKVRFIVSTWTFDRPPSGEWVGLAKFMASDSSWADYIMADSHGDYPRYPLEKGVPGGLPLLNFPEITMWGQSPWGGYGANPFPGRLQRLWNETEKKLFGGFPYSEGIYDDINKVICLQFYWDPDQNAVETVRQYAAFEFSPRIAGKVVRAVQILDQNHLRSSIGPSAVEADAILAEVESQLTPQARSAWRWRVLRLRGIIDHELFKHHGRAQGQVISAAFSELKTLYYVRKSTAGAVRPRQVKPLKK